MTTPEYNKSFYPAWNKARSFVECFEHALQKSEFNMIIDKLKWMRCVVRDSDLDYEKYCNGECGSQCNRPELCNFEKWFKYKVLPGGLHE